MGLGDAFMFQPIFRALLSRYPNAKVSIVAAKNSPVIQILHRTAASIGRKIDHVVEADYKSLTNQERAKIDGEIRRENFDLVICTYMTPVPYFAPSIRSIPYRVGHTIPEKWYKPRPNNIFNIQVPLEQDTTHETERHARLARAIGIEVGNTTAALPLTDEELAFAEDFWREHQLQDRKVIGTHFGASKIQNWKRWNEEGFSSTLANVVDSDTTVLLFGLEEEREGIMASAASVEDRSMDLVGKLSIFQVAALLSKCDMMLANDSGLGHLAMAVGTKAIRIFGMSDYWGYRSLSNPERDIWIGINCSPCLQLGYLKPYNVHNCGHRNCMNLITVEQVSASFNRALASR